MHKANVVRATDGLFLEAAKAVAKEFPEIKMDDANIDAMTMWLLKNPFNYDVLVAPNLYGDIISDLCAQMVGGLGFGCSGNIGKKLAVFEPTHGSAPKYAGQYKVNPIATILAVKMMLDWLGESEKAVALEGCGGRGDQGRQGAHLRYGRFEHDIADGASDCGEAMTAMLTGQDARKIVLHEVGLRDGLQAEKQVVPLEQKIRWTETLLTAGVDIIQLGSFVHPVKVPQMADTDALFKHFSAPGRKPSGAVLSGLVLNEKGLERGMSCGVEMFCMGVSASETHSQKNTGMSIADATTRIIATARLAGVAGKRVQLSVQSAFGCGYEGKVPARSAC